MPAHTTNRTALTSLFSLPTEVATEFLDWHPDGHEQPSTENSSTATSNDVVLSQAELQFLRAVVEQPSKPSSVYPKLARIGPRRARQIRNRLVALGLLREHIVSARARGRPSILLEPIQPAAEKLLVGKG